MGAQASRTMARASGQLALDDWTGSWHLDRREEGWDECLLAAGAPATSSAGGGRAPITPPPADGSESAHELHRYRVDDNSFILEHHAHLWGLHALFRGDLSGELRHDGTAVTPTVAVRAAGADRGLGAGAEGGAEDEAADAVAAAWRHEWVEKPVHFKTEIPDFLGVSGRTLRVDRHLRSRAQIELQVTVIEDGSFVAGPCSAFLRKALDVFPAPVSFLREHGKPLATVEQRRRVLRQVAKMISENIDEITAAHEKDRVFPARFNGVAQMLLGGCAEYERLVEEWMTPEKLDDACPAPLKAGVEADWSVVNEPKGVCINVSPWNAPVQLSVIPMLGMLAAGNRVVVKPPDLVPNISSLFQRLCQKYLSGYVWVEEGGKDAVERLIDEGADHLVFTGGDQVARLVAARCAQTLTPVTLELGGKSPVFIDRSLDDSMLDDAVREILETKVHKTGQFCCAHDFAVVHEEIFDKFCQRFKAAVDAVGEKRNVAVIARRQYEVLKKKLESAVQEGAECVPPLGGSFMPNDQAMTLPMSGLKNPAIISEVLHEEIFGPLLPIIKVADVGEAIETVNHRFTFGKPLIVYCYSSDQETIDAFIAGTSSGNVAVNSGPQRMLCNYNIGFGGIGCSGTGCSMWGREALREFSNRRHVIQARGGFAKSFFSGPPPAPK